LEVGIDYAGHSNRILEAAILLCLDVTKEWEESSIIVAFAESIACDNNLLEEHLLL
jgi:hypothetical protein